MTRTTAAALKQYFGYDTFLPGQQTLIERVLVGQDCFALMPTGAGKSLIYQLATILRPGVGIVISPLIALMQDQVMRLTANGIAATFLNSALTADEQREREAALLRGEIKLLYLAPERLMTARTLTWLEHLRARVGIALLAVDEAHCVSEWGHDFRPEYRKIHEVRERLSDVPTIALTATANARVKQDILIQLHLKNPYMHVASFNRPNLFYEVRPKDRHSYRELVDLLKAHTGEPIIIYCQSRRSVDELTEKLVYDGIAALPYHAGLEQSVRAQNQDRFMRDDTNVLVATVAFGMGIAKPDVRMVIHYDLPRSMEGYYQESGRAGRDGLPAQCIVFTREGDRIKLEHLIRTNENEQLRLIESANLRAVTTYLESDDCRRRPLLAYFGEEWSAPNCGACDNCRDAPTPIDMTIPSQQLLSCIGRTGERFGLNHLIAVLRGSRGERILALGHDKLSTFGIGRDLTEEAWKYLGRALVRQGIAQEDPEYHHLSLTPAAWEVLRGQRRVQITPQRSPKPATPSVPEMRGENTGGAVVDAATTGLFQALRTLRKTVADERQVPPFIIFADTTLWALAEQRPTTPEQFAKIPGIGSSKQSQFGERFTQMIVVYCEEHGLATGRVDPDGLRRVRRERTERAPREVQLTSRITLERFNAGQSIAEIAEERHLTVGTISDHLIKAMQVGVRLDVDRLIAPARFRIIAAALAHAEDDRLTPIKERLGDAFSYEEIRLVKAVLTQRSRE